jgi:hypothetical protein
VRPSLYLVVALLMGKQAAAQASVDPSPACSSGEQDSASASQRWDAEANELRVDPDWAKNSAVQALNRTGSFDADYAAATQALGLVSARAALLLARLEPAS